MQCLFYQNQIQVNLSSGEGEGDRPILDMQCADAIKQDKIQMLCYGNFDLRQIHNIINVNKTEKDFQLTKGLPSYHFGNQKGFLEAMA